MPGAGRRRPGIVGALILLFIARALSSPGLGADPRPELAAVFGGERQPDTLDERGPYAVLVRQVAGASAERGLMHHVAVSRDGRRVSGQDGLRKRTASTFEGRIPGQPRGSTVEYWFSWRTLEGWPVRHPRDPAGVYRFRVLPAIAPSPSIPLRRSARKVRRLPVVNGMVLSLASAGDDRWVGFRGTGVWLGASEAAGRRWTSGTGLPSGTARFILPDLPSGNVYVGTDRGLAIRDQAGSWRVVAPQAAMDEVARLCSDRPCRAGPGALSSLDGTVLFQLEGPASVEQASPPTLPLLLRHGQLDSWRPRLEEGTLAGLFTASFDETDGCFLLGVGLESSDGGFRPAILRRCSASETVAWVAPSSDPAWAAVRRVTALVRDPGGEGLVFAVERERVAAGRRVTDHVLYVLPASGPPRPAAEGAEPLGREVTALVADRPSRRVLVGTFGGGVLELGDRVLRRLPLPPEVPAEVTALAVTDEGHLLVGTSNGAFEVSRSGPTGRLGGRSEDALPEDSLPMDVSIQDGHLLLSSASAGLVELSPGDRDWRVATRLRADRELPAGRYGDARYGSHGEIGALLLGQGLVEWKDKRTRTVDKDEGLHSDQVLRLHARKSGGWWLAFAPLPFHADAGAALQVVVDGRVRRTLPVPDRAMATIGGWIEWPTGQVVLSATRAGLVEIPEEGPLRLRSKEPLSAIARDPVTGTIGVAGSAVARWDGERLVPVLFGLDSGGRSSRRLPGDPFDLAIDRTGNWYLLYRDGLLAILDSRGQLLHLLEPEDGIPPTARRLLAHPQTGEVFVGSAQEGLAVVAPPGDLSTQRPDGALGPRSHRARGP